MMDWRIINRLKRILVSLESSGIVASRESKPFAVLEVENIADAKLNFTFSHHKSLVWGFSGRQLLVAKQYVKTIAETDS